MARLNLTIPDPLYGRMERIRDRVNVSKVCAVALEKELDMLEARPAVADPKIIQVVKRLKSAHQGWYDFGHDDGMAWAVKDASRAAFEFVAANSSDDLMEKWDSIEDAEAAWNEWQANGEYKDAPYVPSMPPGLETLRDTFQYRVAPGLHTRESRALAQEQADRSAYVEGWRDALVELWEAVAPALR